MKLRVEREAEHPAVPEVVHVRREVAEEVGVLSLRSLKTLILPPFSATKTRPSAANSIADGLVETREDGRFLEAGRQRIRSRPASDDE